MGNTYAITQANAYAVAYFNQRGKDMETVPIGEAAVRLGVSPDTIRRRLSRGTLTGHQEPTAQGFRWKVELPESGQETNGHHDWDTLENLVMTLQAQIQTQADELEARRREVSELHVLLQTTQAALTAPKTRPWWRWW